VLEIFIIAFCVYFVINIYTSFIQIVFIQNARKQKAIILEPSKYIEASNYAIEKEKLSIVSSFYSFIIFILWISFGLKTLDMLLPIDEYWLKAIVFVDLFIIINWFLGLPFELYSTFKLDKKYGFSNITPALFIKDTIKTAILFLVFASLIIGIISVIIKLFPLWWLFGFVFIFTVIIVINMLYPIIRAKMFDKFEKLKDKELEIKIENLLKDVGFKSSGVFSVDASKRDSRLNAYFGGLGATKRVVLFDTLIEKLTHNELLAVLGHELGHFKNGDILKNIAITGFVMFVFFAIFGNLNDELFLKLSLQNEPYAIITIFLIFSSILSFFLMPLIFYMPKISKIKWDI